MSVRVRILFVLIFMSGILSTAAYYIRVSLPNSNLIPPYEFFDDFNVGQTRIVFEDERIEMDNAPFLENGQIYIPVDFIKSHIDKYIFWDTKILTLTTGDMLMRVRPDENVRYVNHEPFPINFPILAVRDNAYMPESMVVELYEIEIKYEEAYNTVIIDLPSRGRTTASVASKKETPMRYTPDKKSPIQTKLATSETVQLYESDGEYTLARDKNGLLGYVLTKELSVVESINPTPVVEPERVSVGNRLNIVWDMITTRQSNLNDSRRIVHKGLDVLSPTWFSFDAEKLNGDIISLADRSYVDWAHENGYEVWALITDNFSATVSHAVLSDTEIREHVIIQLLEFVEEYNLDGINIDFEMVLPDDARYFLQFLRELSPLLKERHIILSVDMYVPLYTGYYNRTEIAPVVDYIIIMAYDEHYSGSETSGPVASIPFVEQGIIDTLYEVPQEKIILGLPYYVRIWIEETTDSGTKISTWDVGMNYAYSIFSEQNVEFEWLDDVKYHYGEFYKMEDGKNLRYRVWLEDLASIEEKLKLADDYGLAGVAGWRRNLESEGVWDLIYEYKN